MWNDSRFALVSDAPGGIAALTQRSLSKISEHGVLRRRSHATGERLGMVRQGEHPKASVHR
jgi:hypothetical protein